MRKLLAIALLGVTLPIIPSPAKAQWQQAVPGAVAACASNPALCAVVVTGAGWVLYWRNNPPTLCTWGGCKILHDPESEGGTDSDYVWASSDEQARQMCERMANGRRNRLDRVEQASGWTNNAGKKRYTCYMTVFGR